MAALSYMQRRTSGIYEFRKRLPTELAGQLAPAHLLSELAELINPATGRFKRELTVSLHTNDVAVAKRRDLKEAVRVTDLIANATRLVRSGKPPVAADSSPMSIEDIEAETIAAILKKDEQEREEGDDRRHLQSREERSQWPDLTDPEFGSQGMTDDHHYALGFVIEELAADYRNALARRRPDIVKADLHLLLKAHGQPIDPSSEFYRDAGLAVLRGHVKAYELLQRRQVGEDVPTPQPSPPAHKGPTLSEALTLWKAGGQARGGQQPSPSTSREAERAVRYFKQWHGDMHLEAITKEMARGFRNALAQMPTRQTSKEKKLPLRELLRANLQGREVVHAASVNKYLNLLSAIVTASEREGALDRFPGFTNPFKGLAIGIDKRLEEGRKPFTEEDLRAIFATGIYQRDQRPNGGGGEAAYWLPLIALLSGARQNEIAQLRVKDLKQDAETGIWFFDIGTEGGRVVKNVGSRRAVPLHPELERLGLLEYRTAMAKTGEESSLWPHITSEDGVYKATAWSKWFGRYLRLAANVQDKGLVFHSFRHTFKRMARDAGLSEEMHDALTGHVGSGSVGRGYGAGFGLRALEQAMVKIASSAAVTQLTPWRAGRPTPRRKQ